MRGIERRQIFHDDRDRTDFVARLARVLPECGAVCFAWALVSNHVHLLLQTGERPLAEAMARINTGHAVVFNRRHDRSGYLFQNRYKSLLVRDDAHLLTVLRYIHLNPLEAGAVNSLAQLASYPWTGHATLMGRAAASFQSCEPILEHFGSTQREARTQLHEWMGESGASDVEPMPEVLEPDPDEPSPVRISLATRPARIDPDGFSQALRAGESAQTEEERLLLAVREVCCRFEVSAEELRGRTRGRVSDARAALAYLACVKLRVRGVFVAGWLGLSSATVSRACTRGRQVLRSRSNERAG